MPLPFAVLGVLTVAALATRTFVYEAFRIPGASMVPTLLVGDHVFVAKFAYRQGELPARGDVIVFRLSVGDDAIKRVVGLPGDRVEVHDRHVTLCPGGAECQPLETRPLGPVRLDRKGDSEQAGGDGPFEAFHQFEEHVGGHVHTMQAADSAPQVPGYNEGSWTVEQGHVFVLGDNRDNSQDSRFGPPGGYGQVPLDHIKGRADTIWLSLGSHGLRSGRAGAVP